MSTLETATSSGGSTPRTNKVMPATDVPRDFRWTPFLALFKREIKRFLKVSVQTVLTPAVSSLLYLLIFGVSLGNYIKLKNDLTYLEFLIPGLVMMGCLNNAFQNSSSSVIAAKFSGDLEDLKVAPIRQTDMIWALALGGLVRGLVVGLITWLVGTFFLYFQMGHFLAVEHPIWLAAFLAFGGLSFALLGLSAAFWARNFDQMTAVSSFILVPLMYLGGVFFSIENLHPFWQAIAKVNPLLYFINGVRYGALGVSDVPPETSIIVAGVTLLILYAIAARTLKRASFMRW